MVLKIIGWLILISLIISMIAVIIWYLFYITAQRNTTVLEGFRSSLLIIGSSLFVANLFRFALGLILD